jgi:ABC-type oligopeptide transport system ATPase subunit
VNTRKQQSQPPLLEVRDLTLSFDNREQVAIDRVSFSIQAGTTLGLAGASGAGKSSIARAIMRLIKPGSGEILFNGDNILNMDSQALLATRQRMQIVFQEPSASLSPRRSVEQTMLEPLEHFAIGDTVYRREKIRQVLTTVGLDHDVLQRYPHQFSSGQQQRIAIARALVTNPDLLIADEAVSALDVSVQAQILQLIQSLQKEHGITFLFISHDLAVIRQIASEVAVMYRGQLLEHSPADIFFSQPAHPYSRSLLAFASNKIPAHLLNRKLHLDKGRPPVANSSACVFVHNCVDKMPVCEQLEPVSHYIQHIKQHALGPHCVKCHLYDEANSDEN